VKAVIFDMDGVIVDSESQWQAVENEFFHREVRGWKDVDNARITGLGVEDLFNFLVREFDFAMGKTEFLTHCDASAKKVYNERVDCAEGFLDFARGLKHRGVRTAIATSAPRRWANLVVDRFEISPLLDAVVTADDVGGKTKPLPDLYLEASSRLGLPPGECLAIEDSAIGVLSAKRAGLRAAGYRTPHNEHQDLSAADFELGSFSGLDYERLISRLRR
jgi:HAD superfamily hydrolase (TIGR01509 family)